MTTHAVPRRDNFASENEFRGMAIRSVARRRPLSRLAHRARPLTSAGAFFDTSAIYRKDEILFAAARNVMLNNGIEDFSIRPRRTALRDAIDAVLRWPCGRDHG